MTPGPAEPPAPSGSTPPGRHFSRSYRRETGLLLALALSAATTTGAEGAAGTPRALTLQVAADSTDTPPDPLPPDTLDPNPGAAVPLPDTLDAEADTLQSEPFVLRNLPLRPDPVPARWATGIWEWDREGLESTRAVTLLELVEEVPGVIPLRGGDFGQPQAATAFAAGAGRIRVFVDGSELPPLDGGVVDLARTGLGGLERVRVERRPGELRVYLYPHQFSDTRPYSFLEVGTGDLNTNLFRGVFAHPNALGGNVVVTLDRIDTQGPARREPGASTGVSLRHTLFRGESFGLAWELRRMSSKRPAELWEPPALERSDLGVKARYTWAPWLQAGLVLQRSGLSEGAGDEGRSTSVQRDPLVNTDSRTQIGGHLSAVREHWWADAAYTHQGGPGWASAVQSIQGGASDPALGGVSAGIERQEWDERGTIENRHGRLWTRPVVGLSLFGEIEDGTLGVPFWVAPRIPADSLSGTQGQGTDQTGPLPQLPPDSTETPAHPAVTERRAMRGGIEYRRGSLAAGGAYLVMTADSLHPLGLPTDRDAPPGGAQRLTGFEISGSLPLNLLLTGLSLRGNAQFWEEAVVWRYLPRRIYHARLAYHRTFLDSQNLELWTDIGARGRDPMQIPSPATGADTAPFQQSWFARIQIRVSSVRLFILVDNLTARTENQDYPGRVQPRIRSMYGIRWTLWN